MVGALVNGAEHVRFNGDAGFHNYVMNLAKEEFIVAALSLELQLVGRKGPF